MKIVLMGYMGSGKSAVSRKLALKLGYRSIDLDDFIEEQEGKQISDIFESKGVIYFRKKESAYLSQLINNAESFVLALGGGTPCYGNNLEMLENNPDTVSIYLKGSINLLAGRLWTERSKRPLIAKINEKNELMEFIGKHLFERIPFYSNAKYTISTDNKSVDEIVLEIENLLF